MIDGVPLGLAGTAPALLDEIRVTGDGCSAGTVKLDAPLIDLEVGRDGDALHSIRTLAHV